MPADYKRGERIRVTIDGDVEDGGDGSTLLTLAYLLPESATAHAGIFTDSAAVRIERLIPAEGAPQLGDVWRDRDDVDWFAYNGADRTQINLMSARGEVDDWGFINRERGALTRIYRVPAKQPAEQVPTSPQVGTPAEYTIPIGGVTPKTIVSHPDWNDGEPVEIRRIEDSAVHADQTFVVYQDAYKRTTDVPSAHVDSDMQVTPWTPDGAL